MVSVQVKNFEIFKYCFIFFFVFCAGEIRNLAFESAPAQVASKAAQNHFYLTNLLHLINAWHWVMSTFLLLPQSLHY